MDWGGEGFEEWSEEFMEELLEKETMATQNPTALFPPPSHQTTYSPPPHLSQRPTHNALPPPPLPFLHSTDHPFKLLQRPTTDIFDHFSNALSGTQPPPVPIVVQVDHKDQEIDRLKKELGLVSRKLTDLEHECSVLRNENIKKGEQIKSVYSNNDKIDITVQGLKHANLKCGLLGLDTNAASNDDKSTTLLQKKIVHGIDTGVQTDNDGDYMKLHSEGGQSSQLDLQRKLLGIWRSTSDQSFGRNLISKMFMSCQKDFHQLFGCMSIKIPSTVPGNSVACGISSSASGVDNKHSFHSSEAAKVSYLFTVLTKISNGVLPLESLFESLLDLCNIENVIILQSSLSILHALLRHFLSLGRNFEERNNVKVEVLSTGNNNKDMSRFVVGGGEASTGWRQLGSSSSDSPSLCKSRYWNVDMALSRVNWTSLFHLMHQIAICNRNDCVRLEALSIMNMILIRSNAYTERERFGKRVVFEFVAEFLKNEAGSHVQKEALYLLYLLLNSPQLLSIFCSSFAEVNDDVNGKNDPSNLMAFDVILEGLADCVGRNGNAVKDIEVRKRTLILLAFLASSGKLGFHILVNHKLHGDTTFLMLILQVLMSEIDMEASASVEPLENVKARISFIREALILLNRLVSNPDYSAVVLRALVASRDSATLTCDIASRLSRKVHNLILPDRGSQQIRDTEIVDLARGFRKRIFAYLGDDVS